MEENPKIKWFKEQAVDVFKQTVCSELYGFHLFVRERLPPGKEYYWFESHEKGDAVWLLQRDPGKQEYQILRVEEAKKLSPSQRAAPGVCTFWDSVRIDRTWLGASDTSVEDIRKKVIEGGQTFAERINQAFVNVLVASINSKVLAQNLGLGDTLAQVSDELSEAGFNVDRLLLPKGFLHRLVQQGIIIPDPDDEIQSNHYVGKTKTGLCAFWSSELPGDTALIFDSTAGVTITIDPRFELFAPHPLTIGVGGTVYLNPIVKDIRSVTALEGVGQVIDLIPSQISSVLAAPVSELVTENEGVDLIKPDLDKLPIRKTLKHLIQVLIEDADRAHHAKAYVAAVLLYRSIIEAILLGLLLRRKSKAEDPSGKDVPKYKGGVKPVEDWKLEEMIRRAVAMRLVDDTDESSIRTLQNYGNLVHAARILKKEPFIDPSEDAKIVRSHLIKLFKRYRAISE